MKQKICLIPFCLLICFVCATCIDVEQSVPAWAGGPENGLWYCEELNMQLYFKELDHSDDEALRDGSFDSHSYVLVNDRLTMCNISNSFAIGENHIIVSRYEEIFLDAELVSLNETTWTVRDTNGKTYTFKKIDHLPIHQFWNEHKDMIETYASTANVGEVHHIDIAKEQALSLWETELGIVDVWQKENLKVSFNYENACWLITGTPSASSEGKTPYALIRKNGKVDAVWLE